MARRRHGRIHGLAVLIQRTIRQLDQQPRQLQPRRRRWQLETLITMSASPGEKIPDQHPIQPPADRPQVVNPLDPNAPQPQLDPNEQEPKDTPVNPDDNESKSEPKPAPVGQ